MNKVRRLLERMNGPAVAPTRTKPNPYAPTETPTRRPQHEPRPNKRPHPFRRKEPAPGEEVRPKMLDADARIPEPPILREDATPIAKSPGSVEYPSGAISKKTVGKPADGADPSKEAMQDDDETEGSAEMVAKKPGKVTYHENWMSNSRAKAIILGR